MLDLIFFVLIIACSVIVFIEQKNYEKLTGFSSSPFLIAFGVLVLWIGIFPYYLFKIRKDQYENIEELDNSPYIISMFQGKLILFIGIFIIVTSYVIFAYIHL